MDEIEDADIIVDLSGGKLTTKEYRKRIEQLQAELKKIYIQNEGYGDLLGSANHDVEQLTKYSEDLQSENKKYKWAAEQSLQTLRRTQGYLHGDDVEMNKEICETIREVEQALKG